MPFSPVKDSKTAYLSFLGWNHTKEVQKINFKEQTRDMLILKLAIILKPISKKYIKIL
jgi:hypothetical protein